MVLKRDIEAFKRDLLGSTSLDNLTRRYMLQGTPFVFRRNPGVYDELKGALSTELAVGPDNVIVIGSAKLGFSPAPDKFPKAFTLESDVDIVVVSMELFDAAWLDLLRWHDSPKWQMPPHRREKILEHHEASIYWGHLWPDLLFSFSETASRWVRARRDLSRIPALSPFKVSGRLYRTWDHVMLYHSGSLRKLRARLG